MKKFLLPLALLALCGCGMQAPENGRGAASAPAQKAQPRPSDSLLTKDDMRTCERQSGLAPPAAPADAYALSPAAVAHIKDCAFAREEKRMPLVADLISAYATMLRQGEKECDRDIGTQYGGVCLQKNAESAAAWYDKAAAQRLGNALPGQFPRGGL
ncbi:MAG: hypothetical protein KGL10_07600 [Alphaproteobacteria bacterium]|nr:hypothetical protein [Alphaproteobacteria bacterium]MDE2337160.1 hypothetical protein [Alphaproteobacteria bacterium]